MKNGPALKVVMLGATGAVGGQTVAALEQMPELEVLTLLNRRASVSPGKKATQTHVVDVFDTSTYAALLPGHTSAICTFGVGEPTKVSHDELVRVDKTAVLAFATAAKAAGIGHFQLLSAVLANPVSRNFYLRTKGELQAELAALGFERLSIFQPSIILTPTNRYGLSQALTLAVWPKLHPLLLGGASKFKGTEVATLGRAIAANLLTGGNGVEILQWQDFVRLAAPR
jgi:uncharacterized protein YbjT (DUF2867 family)